MDLLVTHSFISHGVQDDCAYLSSLVLKTDEQVETGQKRGVNVT